jgi:hypothetical protein
MKLLIYQNPKEVLFFIKKTLKIEILIFLKTKNLFNGKGT